MKPNTVVNEVVTQGDEYLRPRDEQAKDRALDPSETSGSATAPSEDALPALTPGDTPRPPTSPAQGDRAQPATKETP